MIKIEHLSKVFHGNGEVVALKDIDLHVEKGDIFGIIGMSGAGKSTLLRCMALLEQPSEGDIWISGHNIKNISQKELLALHRQVGVIFQGYHLLMQQTVRKNVAFPLELEKKPRNQIDTRVDELLQLVGLQDKAEAYPAQLSGGQRQRVAIARALASSPQVLLCDEPTSALDPLTTNSILELLENINKTMGVTIIIITHELGIVESICTKVAVIDSGTIAEQGRAEAVMEHPSSNITKLLLATMGGI